MKTLGCVCCLFALAACAEPAPSAEVRALSRPAFARVRESLSRAPVTTSESGVRTLRGRFHTATIIARDASGKMQQRCVDNAGDLERSLGVAP